MGEYMRAFLDGGDQVILNLLSPESSPARALEVMIVGRVGKALFHELLSAPSIPTCGTTVSLFARWVERAAWCSCRLSVRPNFALVDCGRRTHAAQAPLRALYSMVWRTRCSRRGLKISPAGQRKVSLAGS